MKLQDHRAAMEEGLADDNAACAKERRDKRDEPVIAQVTNIGFWVGGFLIRPVADGQQVYIRHESGEGMACDAATLEAALAAFWAEHF